MDELDTEYQADPVCPHCGHIHQDAFEWRDDDDRVCHKCRKEFNCLREIEVTYSTKAIPADTAKETK